MKRFLSILIALILTVNEARAQTSAQDIANTCGLSQNCGATLNGLVNGGNVVGGTGSFTSLTVTTGNTAYSTVGKQDSYPAAPVYTPDTAYPTPAAAKFITGRYGILAAGAPTAAYLTLPQAAGVSNGVSYGVFNQGSNPLAIVPYPLDTLNVSGAATPFSCTTLKYCECTKLTSTNYGCTIQ